MSLGNWAERLATGWIVLAETESVFLTAATFAIRQVPQLVTAPIAGAFADRYSRGTILLLIEMYKALILGVLALLATNNLEPLWLVFVALAFSGIGHSFELPSTQGLVTGSVPKDVRMNAVAVQSTGVRAVGAVGALASGITIEQLGVPITFITAGVILAIGGALAFLTTGNTGSAVTERSSSVLKDVFDGLKIMAGIPVVRVVLIAAVFVEIFGFAYQAIMPSVADAVLKVDASGLGTLTMMAGIGSVLGSLFLMFLGDFRRKGLLLGLIALLYGTTVATFAAPGSYVFALIAIMGVGASGAAFDAMQWILLQLNVPDSMRGRAVGAWLFAIGFGWVGHLGLGVLGEYFGVQEALAIAGMGVFSVGVLALLVSPNLRRA